MEEALFNKGYCLIGMKRYHEAMDVSGRVVRLNPGHKEAAFNYATCELYIGDAERALEAILPLAERNPGYPLLQALLVLLHLASSQLSPARVAYRRLCALNYDFAGYLQDRAEALDALGRDSLAEQLRSGLKMLQQVDIDGDRTH
jgi:Flp pilus assembly protein TadD